MKIKCEECNEKFDVDQTYGLCPKCNHYHSSTSDTPDLDSSTHTSTDENSKPNLDMILRVVAIILIVVCLGDAINTLFLSNSTTTLTNEQEVSTQIIEDAPLVEDYTQVVESEPVIDVEPEPELEVEEFEFTLDDEIFEKCELPINLVIKDNVVTGYTTTPNLICTVAEIPEGVLEIADYAFEGCEDLEILILSHTVERIGKYAFANLPNLEYVYLLSTELEIIDDYAFFGVAADEVYIAPTVEYIGNYAMSSMNIVEQLPSTTTLGIEAILHEYDRKLLENDLQITNGVLVKYVGSATHLDLPEGVTQIHNNAFSDSTVQTITLPEGLDYIGKSAFYNSSLTEISFPETLTVIDNYAFEGSKNLKKVEFNSNISTVGLSAFANCTNLSDMSFPKSVTSISLDSFSNTIWEEQTKPDNGSDWISYTVLMETISDTTETLTIADRVNVVASYSINGQMDTPSKIVFSDNVWAISKYAINIPHQTPIKLTIPASVKVIDDDLIPYSDLDHDMIMIECEEDSYAHSYAIKHGINYTLY